MRYFPTLIGRLFNRAKDKKDMPQRNRLVAECLEVRTIPALLASFATVTPEIRNTSVDTLLVSFSSPVTGFDLGDLQLTRDGSVNLLTGSESLTSADNTTYSLGNLGILNDTDGNYTITLKATGSGIQNAANESLSANATTTWEIDKTAPMVAIVPSAANSTGGSFFFDIQITDGNFDGSTLSTSDFTLNTTGNACASMFLAGSGSDWTLYIQEVSGTGSIGVTLAANSISDLATNTNSSASVSPTVEVTSFNDDLFADYGTFGTYWYDSATAQWTQISTLDPNILVPGNDGSLVAAFGNFGVWKWSNREWTQISQLYAENIIMTPPEGDDAFGHLFGDFGAYGLYCMPKGYGYWTQVSASNPEGMVATSSGDVIIDFGSNTGAFASHYGTYYGTPSWSYSYFGVGLKQISTMNPENLVASPSGEFFADYGMNGLYRGTSDTWTQVSTYNAEGLAVNLFGELYADFGTNGMWRLVGTDWTQLSTLNPTTLAACENGDVFASFGTFGLYRWATASSTWTQLTLWNADTLASSPSGDLFADFGIYGTWLWNYNTHVWTQISTLNPEGFVNAHTWPPALIGEFESLPVTNLTDPDVRSSPINSAVIIFTSAVTGFDVSDLQLSLDGGPNLLTGSESLTTSDNRTFTLGNLSPLNASDGKYVLTLKAVGSGISTAGNETLYGDISLSWEIDMKGPIATIVPTAGNSTGGPITFDVTISDPHFEPYYMTGDDFTLNTTGTANGTLYYSGSGNHATLTVSNVSGLGTFSITLAANSIRDSVNNTNPTAVVSPAVNLIAPTHGDTFVDYGTSGTYLYSASNGNWTLITTANPDSLTPLNNEDLVADYGDAGVWRWSDTVWTQLSTINVENLTASTSGGIFGDFGSSGIYRMGTGNFTWSKIGTSNADGIVSTGDGDLYADLGASGTWRWALATGTWVQLSTLNPESMAVNSQGDLYADYGANGLWLYSILSSTWLQISTFNAETLTLSSAGELYVDFGDNGLWQRSGSSWTQLSTLNPSTLAVNDIGDIFASFEGYGLYRKTTASTMWTNLTSWNAEALAPQLNGDILADFGIQGTWRWNFTTQNWVQISTMNADAFASA